MTEIEKTFKYLMTLCIEKQASDLHLSANARPALRINGHLRSESETPLSHDEIEQISLFLMRPEQKVLFEKEHTLDMAITYSEERFRINIYRERGHTALAIRRLDNRIRSLKELKLPDSLERLDKLQDGLVIVTGPTGSGKSTTLATIIDRINCSRPCHILTIEDPIEYIHQNKKALIHQRELWHDVDTFAHAVRSAMREDPDVILVGEMRDKETILAAITAAETGHLVFSTLHTSDAPGAIDRISGVFPEGEQVALRKQLSMVLEAVVAQRLLPRRDHKGLVPATEVLWVNSAISHLIREWDPNQIYSFMESGGKEGMQTMEQSLARLVTEGLIEKELALRMSRDSDILEERLAFTKQIN